MNTNKNPKINSINYMKLICAFLVIAIHTHPFEDINKILYYSFSEVLVRIAVPFFFVSSGYFYIKNKCNFSKYIKRLLIVYISWSIIYFIIQLPSYIASNTSLINIAKNFIVSFFIYGSYYHMWYMVALIMCVIITSIFYKLNKMNLLYILSIGLYIIGVIGGAYYKIGSQIPILSNLYNFSLYLQVRRYLLMGLPFFMVGYLIYEIKEIPKNINITTIFTIILFIFEIIIVNILNLQRDIVITFFLYPLVLQIFILCLKFPLQNTSFKINTGKLSSFIYFVHPLIILVLSNFLFKETLLYIATCFISTLIGVILIKVDNKKINRLLF